MRKTRYVVALYLALMSTFAAATPILVGPQDGATGILGLVIEGVTYNVTFSDGATSYEQFFGTDTPTFLGIDEPEPLAAAVAIAEYLNEAAVTDITNLGLLNADDIVRVLFIPTLIEINEGPDQVSGACINNVGDTWNYPLTTVNCRTGSETTSLTSNSWVRFEVVLVPEPGTLGLFAIGLAGIGLVRRRQRTT